MKALFVNQNSFYLLSVQISPVSLIFFKKSPIPFPSSKGVGVSAPVYDYFINFLEELNLPDQL